MKEEKVKVKKNRANKKSLLLLLILLIVIITWSTSMLQGGAEVEESAESELIVRGEEIFVNPDNALPVNSDLTEALPLFASAGADSQVESSPLESTAGDNLPFSADAFAIELPVIGASGDSELSLAGAEETVMLEGETDNEEADDSLPGQPAEPDEENEPGNDQPEVPVANSKVYNFGNSEQFELTQNVSQTDFDNDFIVKDNTWIVSEDGSGLSVLNNNEGRVFVPNLYPDYFVKVVASLGDSPLNREGLPTNRGGYGIMFETSLDDNNNDSGYILQFDRGYGNGEIIIRSRDIRPNSNGAPQTYENSVPLYRFNDRDFLPNKNDNPDWWAAEHLLDMRVSSVDNHDNSESGSNKKLSVHLNEQHLFDWEFESAIKKGEDNYIGLRVWHGVPEIDVLGLEIGELQQEVTESSDLESIKGKQGTVEPSESIEPGPKAEDGHESSKPKPDPAASEPSNSKSIIKESVPNEQGKNEQSSNQSIAKETDNTEAVVKLTGGDSGSTEIAGGNEKTKDDKPVDKLVKETN